MVPPPRAVRTREWRLAIPKGNKIKITNTSISKTGFHLVPARFAVPASPNCQFVGRFAGHHRYLSLTSSIDLRLTSQPSPRRPSLTFRPQMPRCASSLFRSDSRRQSPGPAAAWLSLVGPLNAFRSSGRRSSKDMSGESGRGGGRRNKKGSKNLDGEFVAEGEWSCSYPLSMRIALHDSS
jgi:hypothetical protein